MGLWPVTGPLAPRMLSAVGSYSTGCILAATVGVTGSGTTVANRALFVPIYIPSDIVVQKLFYITSTAPSGNIDMGLYDDQNRLLVSSGSVAIGGASVLAEVDVTDTPVDRGMYYIACATSAAQANNVMFISTGVNSLSMAKAIGIQIQETAFPLPATMTPIVVVGAAYPIIGISQRALVA